MEKRYLIGGAALAALVAMVYMMRSSASAAVSSTGGLSSGIGAAGNANWGTTPIVVNVQAKPTSVTDQVAASPAPAPHAVFGAPGATIAPVPLNDGSNPADPGRNTAEQQNATAAFAAHPFF